MKHDRDSRVRAGSDEIRNSRTMSENIDAQDSSDLLTSQQGSDRPFKDEFNMEALPDPNIIGDKSFHYFWATTTNPQDTPYRRMRMGYQLVKAEDRPDFQHLRLKSGEFEGIVSINEMVLMKLPMDLYQQMMAENHHHRPNDREANLKASAQLGHLDRNGRPLDRELPEDEGFRELGKVRRTPQSFE